MVKNVVFVVLMICDHHEIYAYGLNSHIFIQLLSILHIFLLKLFTVFALKPCFLVEN